MLGDRKRDPNLENYPERGVAFRAAGCRGFVA